MMAGFVPFGDVFVENSLSFVVAAAVIRDGSNDAAAGRSHEGREQETLERRSTRGAAAGNGCRRRDAGFSWHWRRLQRSVVVDGLYADMMMRLFPRDAQHTKRFLQFFLLHLLLQHFLQALRQVLGKGLEVGFCRWFNVFGQTLRAWDEAMMRHKVVVVLSRAMPYRTMLLKRRRE